MWLYFVLRAIEAMVLAVRRLWSRSLPWRLTLSAIGCLSIASIVGESMDQFRLNQDPFYTADSHRRTLRALLAARGPHGRLRWFGPLATFQPVHRANLRGDDRFDMFRVGNDSLEYFSDEAIVPVDQIADLNDGDAILKAHDTSHRYRSAPREGVPPPEIWMARVLSPSRECLGGTSRLQTPDGTIVAHLSVIQGQLSLRHEGVSGSWYVYAKSANGSLSGGDRYDFRAGQAIVLGTSNTSRPLNRICG
jgi:hypothetical protein